MSTVDRYRGLVLAGLARASYGEKGLRYRWASIGQVAMLSGVSRATVKKYLEEGIDTGSVKGIETGLGVCYRPALKANEVVNG